jgi:hypothetical protein
VDEAEVETDDEEEEDEEEKDEDLENAEPGEKKECALSVTAKSSATIKAMPPSRPSSVSPSRETRERNEACVYSTCSSWESQSCLASSERAHKRLCGTKPPSGR